MNGGFDPYVAEGLVMLVRHNREWTRSQESARRGLRQEHNRQLNELRNFHGLSTDRFTSEFEPRWADAPERYRGSEGVDPGTHGGHDWTRTQCRPGEAILAAMERSETRHDLDTTDGTRE